MLLLFMGLYVLTLKINNNMIEITDVLNYI